MVSCGTMEKSNIITVAWTGILNTNPAMCYISVRPERYSHDIIKENGEFAINLTTRQLAYATDWCGVKSGRDVDKFKEMKLTKEKANIISVPSKCDLIAYANGGYYPLESKIGKFGYSVQKKSKTAKNSKINAKRTKNKIK